MKLWILLFGFCWFLMFPQLKGWVEALNAWEGQTVSQKLKFSGKMFPRNILLSRKNSCPFLFTARHHRTWSSRAGRITSISRKRCWYVSAYIVKLGIKLYKPNILRTVASIDPYRDQYFDVWLIHLVRFPGGDGGVRTRNEKKPTHQPIFSLRYRPTFTNL